MSRYAYIDSIRAIAALLVIYLHVALAFSLGGRPVSAAEHGLFFLATGIVDVGKIGVTLFFAVSGFVIPFSLLSSPVDAGRNFIIGRVFRLYPAYWVSLVAAGVVAASNGTYFSRKAVFFNIAMLQDFVRQPTMQGLYWTLQIEMIFYVLCFCLLKIGMLGKVAAIRMVAVSILLIAIIMSAARLISGAALPVALPLALFVMFLGMIWRFNIVEKDLTARVLVRKMLVLFVFAIPIISFMAYRQDELPGISWLRYTCTYYTAISIFLLLTTKARINSPIMAYLGALSYSIYLFGALVQVVLETQFPVLRNGTLPAHVLVFLIYAVTIMLAAFNYHFVERPGIRLGKRLMGYLDRRSPKSERLGEVI